MAWLATGTVVPWSLLGCGGGGSGSGGESNDSATGASNSCLNEIASETGGPYPADGSNSNNGSTVDVLALSGIVRADIRSNIGSSSALSGLPLTLTLTVVDVNNSCTPVANASVYIWHCDANGEYSAYNAGANGSHSGETYLRGVQITDSLGQVTFTTIYPGWYEGRITHVHAEVYANASHVSGTPIKTTQFAFTPSVTTAVYANYSKGQNTSVTSFSADGVFSDGTDTEMLNLTGDTTSGYRGTLTLGVAL